MRSLISIAIFGFQAGSLFGQVDTIVSGSPESFQYCYAADLDTQMVYRAIGAEPLYLHFCAGQILQPNDQIIVYDGPDDQAPLLYISLGSGILDLTGIFTISTGQALLLEFISDGSMDCQSGGLVPLFWSVSVDGLSPCVLGIEEPRAADIQLHPNPADEVLNIRSRPGVDRVQIELRDLSGRIMACPVDRSGDDWTMDTRALCNGEYVLNVTEAHRVSVRKVLVLH